MARSCSAFSVSATANHGWHRRVCVQGNLAEAIGVGNHDGGSAPLDGVGHEAVPVEALPAQRDKHVAGLHRSGIGAGAAYVLPFVTAQKCAMRPVHEVGNTPRRHNYRFIL